MKSDRRVRYTRRALQQSLLEILREKTIDRVSVKEICERADVNRSMFYVHFGSPQELLDSVCEEMMAEIRGRRLVDYGDLRAWMAQICEVIYEYRELLEIFVRNGGHMDLFFLIAGVWKEDFMRGLRGRFPSEELAELAYLYVTTGASGAIYTWAFGGFKMDREELVDHVYRLVMQGLGGWIE